MTARSRMQQITAMLEEMPEDHELRYMLAMEHVSAGDDATAVTVFEELMRRAPDYPPGYHQAARALARLERLDEARAVLRRGIPIAQARGDAHTAGEMADFLSGIEG